MKTKTSYLVLCLVVLSNLLFCSQTFAQIKLYSMNGCGRCAMAKEYLTEKKVKFEEINTSLNDDNNGKMWAALASKNISGSVQMPVIDNNGEVSYSIADLSDYLNKLASGKSTKVEVKPAKTKINFKWSAQKGLPANAILAPNTAKNYVIRSNYEGAMHPGVYNANTKKAYIAWGGREVAVVDFEFLTGKKTDFEWVTDDSESNTKFLSSIISTGVENENKLIPCVALAADGKWYLGKTWVGYDHCNVPYKGVETLMPTYKILVEKQK